MSRPVTRQGVPSLDGPRNGRTREHVVAAPAKSTRCQHNFEEVVDEYGTPVLKCIACPHIRGERTGRGFR
jgi:hypothetical protein